MLNKQRAGRPVILSDHLRRRVEHLPRLVGATLNSCTVFSSARRNSLDENVCTFM